MPRSSARSLRAATALVVSALACVNGGDVRIASANADVTDAPSGAATNYVGQIAAYAVMQASTDGTSWYNLSADLAGVPAATSVTGPRSADGPLLSMGPQTVRVDLRDTTRTPLHQNAVLPADTYRFVRLVLSPRIPPSTFMPPTTVRLTGTMGGVFYDDRTFNVTTRTVIVQREIAPLALGDGDRVAFEWDFNSEVWLTPEALAANAIDTTTVKAAIGLTVRKN